MIDDGGKPAERPPCKESLDGFFKVGEPLGEVSAGGLVFGGGDDGEEGMSASRLAPGRAVLAVPCRSVSLLTTYTLVGGFCRGTREGMERCLT